MNFKLIRKDNVFYADSRQVAELVDKRHDHLVRDIDGYIKTLSKNPKLGASNFMNKVLRNRRRIGQCQQ